MDPRYTIRAVAARTGLSQHTIRAWERRYGALTPERTETNRRLYGQADVERLTLLGRAVAAGHAISQVADLSNDALLEMAADAAPAAKHSSKPRRFVAECEGAIRRMDAATFEHTLLNATAELGAHAVIDDVLVPLIRHIDHGWQAGTVGVAQEHLASTAIRAQLDRIRTWMTPQPFAPRIVVTTPAGQSHELGATLVATVAALQGWHVVYLGSNMPSHEIASATRRVEARAVALSLVYPEDDPGMRAQLGDLRTQLGDGFPILAGGRAATAYEDELVAVGAMILESLPELRDALDSLRA